MVKTANPWKPARLGMGKAQAGHLAWNRVSKRTADTMGSAMNTFVFPPLVAAALYVGVSPSCILGSKYAAQSHAPETAALVGLGASGLWWILTGGTGAALSGAVSVLGLYVICKTVGK